MGNANLCKIGTGRKNYFYYKIQGTEGTVFYNLERMCEVQVYFKTDADANHGRDCGFRAVLLNPEHEGFHHHMATVVQTFEETKRLMDNTDPRYVYLCFDTGHFTFSKEDAVKAAKAFGPRIGHVHLKDIRPERMERAYTEGFKFCKAVLEKCFTVPGDGCVDYPGVFSARNEAHYEGWFIVEAEQDPAKANPFEYALMARNYISKVADIEKYMILSIGTIHSSNGTDFSISYPVCLHNDL